MRQSFAHLTSQPFAALAAAWLAALLVVGLLVIEARTAAIDDSKNATTILAHLLEEHTARTFQAASIVLEQLAQEYEAQANLRPDDPGFQRHLAKRLAELPAARALFIIGRDGFIRHDTDYPKTPRLSLADRRYFLSQQSNPTRQLGVSEPLVSRTPDLGWFVAATWPIFRSGAFDGVLVAALRPDYFRSLYEQIGLKPGDIVRLHHRDGTLVAQYPREGEAPESLNPPTGASRNAHYTYVASHRAMADLPFVVTVAHRMDDVLYGWRRSAWAALIAMLGLTALLSLFLLRLERDRRQREVERRRRAQADKLEAVGQLTGGLAHDFANFLQLIAMNLALLRSEAASAQQRNHALNSMEHAVERSAALIKRLLSFAKRETLQVSALNLNALISGTHDLLGQAAGQSVEMIYQLDEALPPVVGDRSQIETALLNLILNARDAMAGRGRIVVRTYLGEADQRVLRPGASRACFAGRVCLAIEDNGPGMSEEVRRRALEPFFSTKGAAGTGLGLPQVYGFMQQIGGDLHIEATPGAGTTVTLIFPAAAVRLSSPADPSLRTPARGGLEP